MTESTFLWGLGVLAAFFVGASLVVFVLDMVLDKFNGRRQ
jgi:hypothetical protein